MRWAGSGTIGAWLAATAATARPVAATAPDADAATPDSPVATSRTPGTLADQAERPAGEVQPAERDVEEGPHHLGVELGAGAAGQLEAGLGRRQRLLVGPGRGHAVVHVRDRDDPPGEGDLLAREPARVALAVDQRSWCSVGAPSHSPSHGSQRRQHPAPRHGVDAEDSSHSSSVGRRLVRISGETASLPTSCTSAAHRSFSRSAVGGRAPRR